MKIIAECWDKQQTLSKEKNVVKENTETTNKKVVKEDLQTANVVSNAIGIGSGAYGVYLRNKRHQILFNKVMKKFPTAKDMCKFLNSRGYNVKGLEPDATTPEYIEWVRRNITKEGRFWRIFWQVLGFGLASGIYNISKYNIEKDRTAEQSVDAYMR